MEISDITIKLLLLFLPGIICTYVVDVLTSGTSRDRFFFILRCVVLGMTSYLSVYLALWFIFPVRVLIGHIVPWLAPSGSPRLLFFDTISDADVGLSPQEISVACLAAVILGFLFAYAYNRRWIARAGRRLGVTATFDEEDVWAYTFNQTNTEWATVRDLDNDLVYDGWIQAFSENSKNPELLLRDVSVYRNTSGEALYQVGALYVARNVADISIEFRKVEVNPSVDWRQMADEQRSDSEESPADS